MKSYGSANIKIALFITGIIIMIATLIYTQVLVAEILAKRREIANFTQNRLRFMQTMKTSREYNLFSTM
jgi:hypothetical protein